MILKTKIHPLDMEKIDIPEFIPDGKYLGISRNTIVVIEDSMQEAMKKLFEKFLESATGIIRKGEEIESFETLFSLFSAGNTKCYHQTKIYNNFYPILEFSIINNGETRSLLGIIDTGASLTAINKEIIKEYDMNPVKTSTILTANGIIEAPIYNGSFRYESQVVELQFVTADISGPLAIQALIGKNFIDKFNLMFLGKEKLFCIQLLE